MTGCNRIRAIVVEDSRLAREGLVEMLAAFPLVEVVGQAQHPDSAIDLIRELQPQLLFLDIHMPGQTGFDLLGQLDYEPLIIFTTAYSEYAIRSFEFQTVDYLLKPISEARLAQAIDKLKRYADDLASESETERMDPEHRLFVKDGEECHLVTLTDIRYFESCKNYVRLFFDSRSAFIKKSLNQVEQRIPDGLFFRCSRQYIINLREVTGIEESIDEGLAATMSDGKKIEVSRRNAAKLKSMLSF